MGTRREEVEHYYKNNPSKPYSNPTQYKKPIGPEHPHANVKEGKKELGPTRADLERHEADVEKERQRKFQVNFQIEREVNAARLRQEKADERAAQKSVKDVEKGDTKPPKTLAGRAIRGFAGLVDSVGPNPFGQSRREYSRRPQVESGFSSGGFPSMGTGFGGGLNVGFPAFGGGGNKGKKDAGMSSGLGFRGIGVDFSSGFGGSAPAPKRHRRRRPSKRRHKRG